MEDVCQINVPDFIADQDSVQRIQKLRLVKHSTYQRTKLCIFHTPGQTHTLHQQATLEKTTTKWSNLQQPTARRSKPVTAPTAMSAKVAISITCPTSGPYQPSLPSSLPAARQSRKSLTLPNNSRSSMALSSAQQLAWTRPSSTSRKPPSLAAIWQQSKRSFGIW